MSEGVGRSRLLKAMESTLEALFAMLQQVMQQASRLSGGMHLLNSRRFGALQDRLPWQVGYESVAAIDAPVVPVVTSHHSAFHSMAN